MGFIFDAAGYAMQASATKKQAKLEKVAAEHEATQLETRSKETMAAGTFVADQIKAKSEKILSAQKAKFAAEGDTTSGTAAEFRAESIKNASMDELMTIINARSDADKDIEEAKITRETGKRKSQILHNQSWGQALSATASLIKGPQGGWQKTFGG